MMARTEFVSSPPREDLPWGYPAILIARLSSVEVNSSWVLPYTHSCGPYAQFSFPVAVQFLVNLGRIVMGGLKPVFSTFDRTPWTRVNLLQGQHKTERLLGQTSMRRVGLEPTIPILNGSRPTP
jgi:hypothetical protein